MTCDERREQFLLFAADALEPAERDELLGHLRSGCPRCAGSLAEARAVLAHLPLALEPAAPLPEIKQRLMARVAAASARRERPVERFLAPLFSAGLAAAAVYAMVAVPLSRERESLRRDLTAQAERIRTLENSVEQQGETARLLQSREAVVATLAGSEPQPEAWGRILWDREHRTVHFYSGNLKPPTPGRTYELWLINERQEKIPAGTFEVDASSRGQLVTRLTQDVGEVVLAAVTDEPAGGVPQPTGSIQLVGKLRPSS